MKRLLFALILFPCLLMAKDGTKTAICGAKTAKGTECQMKVDAPGGKCRWHDPKTSRCTAIKKDGKPCKIVVNPQQQYCRYHNNSK